MKRSSSLAAALALLLMTGACMKKSDQLGGPPARASADTVVALTRTLHYETADCRAPGGAPCLRLDTSYPILLSVPGGDTLALNRDLRRRLNSGLVGGEPPVFSDPDSMLRERVGSFEKPLPGSAPWYDETTAKLEHFTPGLVTLSIEESAYAGGAHPNTSTVYLVLDSRTAAEVPLDSVLVPGARPELVAAVERAFRKARGMSADSSLANVGFWFKQRFELTPNWGLVPDGLRFHYNPYEVAPYSMGPTTANVPWSSLSGIVRPRYLPRP